MIYSMVVEGVVIMQGRNRPWVLGVCSSVCFSGVDDGGGSDEADVDLGVEVTFDSGLSVGLDEGLLPSLRFQVNRCLYKFPACSQNIRRRSPWSGHPSLIVLIIVVWMKGEEDLKSEHLESAAMGQQKTTTFRFRFDLSPLIEEKEEEKEEIRFATSKPASSVISTMEDLAKTTNFSIRKSDTSVRLQGLMDGRKGMLGIDADIFAVAPSIVMVEVKKSSGDRLEYNQFCKTELRPRKLESL